MAMKHLEVKVEYNKEKDFLTIEVVPRPSVETRAAGLDYDFLIFHAKDNPETIVGMQSLDFSNLAKHLDEPGIVPNLDFIFDVLGTDLRGVTLKEMLEWAHSQFILKQRLSELERVRALMRAVVPSRPSYTIAPYFAYSYAEYSISSGWMLPTR